MIHFNSSVFLIFLLAFIEIKLSCAEPIINTDVSDPSNAPEKVSFSDYPFVVSIGLKTDPVKKTALQKRQGHFCGGALVTKLHVVTAAHCFDNDEKKAYIRVLVGMSNFNEELEEIGIKGWTKYIDWPKRKLEGQDHDIAVLTLEKAVTTSNVVPIPLYDKYYDRSNIDLESIGWGKTEQYLTSPDLLKIPLNIIPRARCEREFQDLIGDLFFIRMWKVCTRSPKKLYLGSGDSGGPLIYKDSGIMKLFGVNEANCDQTCLMLNIHTRIYNYIDFIKDMIK